LIEAPALAANFIREIRVGIGDTGIKAGLIKVASGRAPMDDYARRALTAGGMAQAETGVGVITHTDAGMLGLEQVAMLVGAGADPTRIVIGHNDTADLAYLKAILDTGATLGIDRLNNDQFLPEPLRIAALRALLDLGYENQIVLSQDCVAGLAHYERGYRHVTDHVLPALREAGVSEAAIEQMMVHNPRRILAGA
jgi:phosphotriesterase-related protein